LLLDRTNRLEGHRETKRIQGTFHNKILKPKRKKTTLKKIDKIPNLLEKPKQFGISYFMWELMTFSKKILDETLKEGII
jgi:hypothetical protein